MLTKDDFDEIQAYEGEVAAGMNPPDNARPRIYSKYTGAPNTFMELRLDTDNVGGGIYTNEVNVLLTPGGRSMKWPVSQIITDLNLPPDAKDIPFGDFGRVALEALVREVVESEKPTPKKKTKKWQRAFGPDSKFAKNLAKRRAAKK
jgi:hypothetical protein